MNEKYIGSDFDDFLVEEGLLAQAETTAIKRVIAYQVSQMMAEQKLSKAAMARRMHTSRAALERLLDPENESVTLHTMEKAAEALGKRLQIRLA
jgi:antitoxin HicB